MRSRFGVLLRAGLVLPWVLLGLLGLPVFVAAGDGAGNLWQSFIIGDGIPSGNVLALTAARDGTLWLGTDAGVGYYDGQWHPVAVADDLSSKRIRAIVQTEDGALWFASDAGLARRAPDGDCCRVWTTADGLPDNDVRTLTISSQFPQEGTRPGVWVGTKRGLVYVDGENVVPDMPVPDGEILATAGAADGALFVSVSGEGVWQREAGGTWRRLGTAAPAQGDPFALWVGRDGRVWGGAQDGLIYYADGRWQQFPLSDDDSRLTVLSVLQDNDDGLWVGTDRGVFYVADATAEGEPVVHFVARTGGLVNDHVRAIALSSDGALWFGTIGGVSRYGGNTWQEVRTEDLAGQRINSVLVDSAGRTWVGTEYNGLVRLDGGTWRQFTTLDGLPGDRVITVFEDRAGRIWVGTGAGVAYLNDPAAGRFQQVSGLGPVYAFAEDSNRVLWLGAERGLHRWTPAEGPVPVPEFAGQRVNAIHQADDGTLWVGTQTDGLLRLVDGQWQGLAGAAPGQAQGAAGGKPLFNDIVVNGIGELADGSLWAGTYNDGLWRGQGGDWKRMDARLVSPKILSLSAAGRFLWVGTRQGLAGYDSQTWQTYSGDVLPSPRVLALAPGEDGSLWIGTMEGLVHYRPEKQPPWIAVESVNLIPVQDGKVALADNVLQEVRIQAGDLATRAGDLIFLSLLDGVDATTQIQTDAEFRSYRARVLAPGTHRLQVKARDAAFNYSAPAEVQILVPPMVTMPGGFSLRAGVFYSMLGLSLLALAAVVTAGGVGLRARVRERRLAAATAARQREALERAFNPYISGEPVRQPDMFFGRDELLRRIFNALHQNSIMIHGERRMGKTTLLYQLAAQLREADDPEWAFVPVYIDLEGTSQSRFFHTLMEAIWGALQAYMLGDPPPLRLAESWPEAYTDREFAVDLRSILDSIKEVVAPRKVRVILLLDEMDVVNSYDTVVQQQLRRIFMSSLAINLGAVVAGIQISKAWDRVESPWYNMFNEIPLEPFTDEQARRLLSEPVRGIYEWDPEAMAFVLQHAEGRPYRLQQYALEAVNRMLVAKRLHITLEDVQTAHEIVERAHVS